MAVHADIEAEDQSVYIPKIRTELKNNDTDAHVAGAGRNLQLIDLVTYENLIPGKTYVMRGALMVKETGKALQADGKDVVVEKRFTAETANGQVELDFTVDGSGLAGRTLVAFEECLLNGKVVAEHKDLEDEGQSVHLPKISTRVNVPATGAQIIDAGKEMVIEDHVSYQNLVPGLTYTMQGRLMDAETGKPLLDAADKEITAATEFAPETANGTAVVTFRFDGSHLAGTKAVVFEKCLYQEVEISSHEDPKDEDQIFYIPKISTKLKDEITGSKNALASEKITLVDEVSYKGLKPGLTYTMKAVLMNKATGEPLVVNGEKVTAETTFTPQKPEGKVDVSFQFDGSVLAGETVVAFEQCLYQGIEVAVHADIEDKEQTVYIPKISTEAKSLDTNDHLGNAGKKAEITDVVTYENLIEGQTYTMRGTLMLKDTGEPLVENGKEVTVETEFVAAAAKGQVALTFQFDASVLHGRTLVAYERCLLDGRAVAVHCELEDEAQSVHLPKISTHAKDNVTGEDMAKADQKITIIDEVSYRNLVAGKTYVVHGTLMNKSTGEPLLVNGERVTSEVEFTPEEPDGKVELSFTFDGSALAGETVVAFEKCLYEGIEVACHEDIEDRDQVIYIPKITTALKDTKTGTQNAFAGKTTLVDEIHYSNLVAGREYEMHGILMDKKTGKPLLINGKTIESTLQFTPDEPDGTVEMEFSYDGAALAGATVVAFEECQYNGKTVAEHKDLEAREQSVYIPKIATYAMDAATGTQQGVPSENTTITDEVTYENLIPGRTYRMEGRLMDPSTGKALVVNGKEVTAELEFVPEAANGKVELQFTFDSIGLGERSVVVFQRCYVKTTAAENGEGPVEDTWELVAAHEDIDSESQSVLIRPETPAPKTGDDSDIALWAAMGCIAACGLAAGALLVRAKKRKHGSK